MFRDVKEMTTEEIEKELQAIELFQSEIGKVNVNTLLNKSVDTSFLTPMQCTITPNGQLFRTDKQGFLPKMMEEMYVDRSKFKKMMLAAKQEYENETDDSKKYDIEKRIARYNNLYLNLGPLVQHAMGDRSKDINRTISFMDKVCEDKIQPFIDKSYGELADYVKAYSQKMQMKREGLSNKGVWTAKKRYILNVYNNEGVQYKEPQMKVMGLEMIKSSTPSAIREKMKEAIKLMMTGTENDVQSFIANFREEFKRLPPEEISFPRGLNGLNTYSDSVTLYKKGTPIHVKGAILYNHNLKLMGLEKKYQKIQEGEKIKFTYLKMPNHFKDTVISFPSRIPKEFELDRFIDYDVQFDKAFLEPIRVILDCMKWKVEKNNSLEDFFS